MHDTPLTAAHRARGLSLSPQKGALVPDAFGPLADELAAAERAAVADLGWVGHALVTGRHRARFLHAMSTCQVKTLAAGASNVGMFLDGKGHVVAQFLVDAEPDAHRLELGREDVERAIAQLLRYRVADLVDFAPLPGLSLVALTGAEAEAVLATAALPAPEAELAWRDAPFAGVTVRVRRYAGRLGRPGFDLTIPSDAAPALWEALLAAGAAPLGRAAWDVLRVTGGTPLDGVDLDESFAPLEAPRLAAVLDWKKGCYLGQEVVCMMNDRGQPTRQLCTVALPVDAAAPDAPGLPLFAAAAGDKPVGRLGTVTRPPGRPTAVALAIVKRKHAAPGTALRLADGCEVTVLS